MNSKISSLQIGMVLSLICASLYLGLSDIILIEKAQNDVLISMVIGIIIGIIPILMFIKINNTYPTLNIYKKNLKLFNPILGNILNFLIFLVFFIFFTISIRSIVIFLISKYLEQTPFYLIGLLVITTSLIINFKGLKTILRISQILFFLSLILVIIIEVFLLKYVEINNVMPMLNTSNVLNNIFEGSVYYASSCALLSFLLLSINKSRIVDQNKFSKNIILFYLLTSVSLTIVMFFVISCFGYKMASLFRYPEYILLKKIALSNSDLHLENLLAFRWIFYIFSLTNASLYGIKKYFNIYVRNKKASKISVIIIALISMVLANTAFGNIPNSIILIKDYYVPYLAFPLIIIISVIFIKTFFIKKES